VLSKCHMPLSLDQQVLHRVSMYSRILCAAYRLVPATLLHHQDAATITTDKFPDRNTRHDISTIFLENIILLYITFKEIMWSTSVTLQSATGKRRKADESWVSSWMMTDVTSDGRLFQVLGAAMGMLVTDRRQLCHRVQPINPSHSVKFCTDSPHRSGENPPMYTRDGPENGTFSISACCDLYPKTWS